jgi:hypothetical protein
MTGLRNIVWRRWDRSLLTPLTLLSNDAKITGANRDENAARYKHRPETQRLRVRRAVLSCNAPSEPTCSFF